MTVTVKHFARFELHRIRKSSVFLLSNFSKLSFRTKKTNFNKNDKGVNALKFQTIIHHLWLGHGYSFSR